MSKTAKELREKRAKLVHEARALLDQADAQKRDLTAEEQERWDKIMGGTAPDGTKVVGKVDKLMVKIDRLERLSTAEASVSAIQGDRTIAAQSWEGATAKVLAGDGPSQITDEHRSLALQGWMRAQVGFTQTEKHIEAMRLLGVQPWQPRLCILPYTTDQMRALRDAFRHGHPSGGAERCRALQFGAALSNQSGPSGGYLVPAETLRRELEINMLAYGGMRQVSESISTTTGERIAWPTVDDTANKGVLLGVNQAAPTTGSQPTFGKVLWDAYRYTSNSPDGTPVLVPLDLLQDSFINFDRLLGELLGIRLGRISNDYYTTGTGAAQPKGIVTAAGTFNAASSTAIAFDDIFGLVHALDPAYRTADCGFMSHDQVILGIRKLKDGLGRYLWEPGLQIGAPDRILGYEWTVNQSMSSTFASGNKVLLFGRLSNYKIRRVAGGLEGGMELYHLRERYIDQYQHGFMATMREDGNLLTAGTDPVKVLKNP